MYPDVKDLPRADTCQDLQEFGSKGLQGFDAIAHGDQYDDRDRKVRAILLILEVAVAGYQHVELTGGAPEKVSIGKSRPPGLPNRSYLVPRQVLTEVAWQGFVKQDAHLR